MPLLEGRTLQEQHLPLRAAVATLRDIALAIAHAHAHGVLHRDLKPGNILLTESGQAFVLDFGLAFLRQEEGKVSRPGDIFGTAAYMPPEQARGDAGAAAPAADVYGLGATLYHAVTGQAPFAGSGAGEIAAKVLTQDPVPPRRLRRNLDRRLIAILSRAMEKEPRRRYPSAEALAEDLRRWLHGGSVLAKPEGPLGRLQRWGVRHPARATTALFGIVALGLGIAQVRGQSERTAALGAIGSMREMAALSLENALRLRRAGDLAGMHLALPPVLQAYERARVAGAATAEVEHIMGQMYRALLANDTALAFQERALTREPNLAPALYERAVLLAARYGEEAQRRFNWRENELRDDRTALPPSATALRARILADGRRLEQLPWGGTQALAARGFVAFHDGHFEQARQAFAHVIDSEPNREEAWLMLGRSLVRLNRQKDAHRVFTAGIERDKGFLPLRLGRCFVRANALDRQSAILDADATLLMDPASSEARLCRGTARMYLGHDEIFKGQDALATLALAEADLSAVLVQEGIRVDVLWARGVVRRYRAMWRLRRA